MAFSNDYLLSTMGISNPSNAPATKGDVAALRKVYDDYVKNVLNPIYKDFAKVKEKVEILDGSRSRTVIGKSAVRFEDLRYIDKFPTRPPHYKYLGAAPTAADYNALAADVKKLYEMLGQISMLISSRL